MSIDYIFIFALALAFVALIIAYWRKWISKQSLEILGAIATIIGLFAAVAVFVIPAATDDPPLFATGGNPVIHVVNELQRPVEITIENVRKGWINPGDTKTYLIDSFPAYIEWTAQHAETSAGSRLGEYLAGRLPGVNNNATVRIDSVIEDQPYYYLKAFNNTNTPCSFIVDFGLSTEFKRNDNFIIKPGVKSDLGYYKRHDNSNVYFYCEDNLGSPYYWREKATDDFIGTALSGEIDPSSNVLNLRIED